MSRNLILSTLFVFFSTSLSPLGSSFSLSSDLPPTVYELLPKYGLPPGLLPDTVTNYTLQDDGRFVVVLAAPCYIQFEYLVYYDKTITGKLGYGSITELKGIQVKRFFIWFNVDEIKVDLPPSESIYFQVGVINKRLDLGQFESVHSCRDDKISGSACGSWKRVLQFPTLNDEVEMLITE